MQAHPLRSVVVLACLLILAGVGFFILYPQVAAAYHWRKAQRAIEQYDFAQAQTHLQRCLETWPESGETRFLLARTCRRAGDFAAARTQLREAERLGWRPALLELERLLMRAQAGMVHAVEQALRRHLAARPDEETVILEALVIGSLQGNFLDDAYRWSTRWTEHDPEDWQARLMRGRVFESGLRYDLAAEEYQNALERKPDLAAAHLGLGEMLLRKGFYAEALPHFRACTGSAANDAAALLGVARCQRCLESPEVTIATLEQLLAGHEQHAGAWLLRGQLELERGNPEEALVWLQRAEHLAPQDMDTNQTLATALRLLNRKQEAQVYERKKLEIERDLRRMEQLTKDIIENPKDVELRCEAGTILMRLGQWQQGAHWLVSALLIDPHDPPTKQALAACLAELGDPKLVEHYRRILEDRGSAAAQAP